MSLTSKSTLSLKKKEVQEQKKAGTAYRRLVFAHKASAGETGINFTSLTQPSEMAALGFSNPSSGDILAANILFYKKNLTIISSARGTLMQDLSYTVPTSSRVEFQGFTALEGEIFTCLLETGVRDGLNVVDASPIIATGELAIGATDFNVGTPFEVNKYSAQQIGAVLVFRNGQIQFRNPSNGTSGGNYQEVDNGSGLGTVIRFNVAPVSQADNIVVWGHLLAERPDGSMMAAIESLAGQLDTMIPTLAALAGVPESTFQGAPNNQDLKSFGDRVLSQENRIVVLENAKVVVEYVYNSNTADSDDTSSFATGSGGVSFGAYTGTPRRKRVQFSDVCGAKDVIQLELLQSGAWTPLGSNSRYVMPAINATQGVYLEPQSDARQFDVVFQGSVREPGAATWSTIAGSAIFKWRVARYRYGV